MTSSSVLIRYNECVGRRKEYKICERQACTRKYIDYRNEACRKHNRKTFRGRRYYWESYINRTKTLHSNKTVTPTIN
ncbi:hypothetical protein KUTeg_017995 [Tegillarca granosa]|uniref:Uncharacterized protein n=1 Tax=Tegillarca granosa TaxID=220873 RepID=A0ABQ9EKF2_TEGGR|nr:hypothetical protein KUTeg_017995 [Tegillarca granosa]